MSSLLRTVVLGLIVLALGAVTASAQTTPTRDQRWRAITNGAQAYVVYCAQCHGPDGKGNGPLASKLKTKVPDLTSLTVRHQKFDKVWVLEHIYGTNVQDRPGMPAWGAYLHTKEQSDAYALLTAHNVMRHVEGMQQGALVAEKK